ncbi:MULTISPECIES: GlxA family transcriptional regulator [Achromobacter]|uniref:AraC family transcriptional regulator n=1 Tax=Achromobacter spanius TaxID=217203 RepID=A0ABY8H1I7_9BURK|nr:MULTISPECIES: AraC family transcriptional regulator [Achromobacter]WAI86441.1 AraC family transcriptional regulator [Achromobacter spanius]WEX97432.1 AraC family transcriptional regulator [Achromobacter sp. SS2-2022]WFP11010.1 AraC family transcriptional regulator [Achromobacter spanius]
MLFMLYDGFQPLDLAGPWQAFSSANEEAGQPLYQLSTIAATPVVSTWEQGLRMQVDGTFEQDGDAPIDMLLVPGGPGADRASAHAETMAWLRRRDVGAPRTCSVCTGAFVLAAAGLLDGRAVTTHWRSADRLRQKYPALRVQDDRIFIESGKYWTSAGVTAGIDLALALIERDVGAALSQQVARRLVVFMRRDGDQRQYSQTLRLQDRVAAPFRDLVEKIEAKLSARWSVDDMADACQMSRRTFQRKFAAHFGVAPTEVLRRLRQERASALQATGKMSKKSVQQHVGPLHDRPEP